MAISFKDEDHAWFADMENFKATRQPLEGMKFHYRKSFFRETTKYVWDEPTLFRIGIENLLRQCVTKGEQASILWHCHNSLYGDHFNAERTTAKILQAKFYWPTLCKGAHNHALSCDNCQLTNNISRHEMPLQNTQEVEVFDCWGIDFIGPLPSLSCNKYNLVAVDYVSKWVK